VESNDRAHVVRMIRLAVLGIAAEAVVYCLGYVTPAMRPLLLPVYLLIGVLFAFALWHAARRRPGHERRHGLGDRRQGDRRD
jgi:hypothetical protein